MSCWGAAKLSFIVPHLCLMKLLNDMWLDTEAQIMPIRQTRNPHLHPQQAPWLCVGTCFSYPLYILFIQGFTIHQPGRCGLPWKPLPYSASWGNRVDIVVTGRFFGGKRWLGNRRHAKLAICLADNNNAQAAVQFYFQYYSSSGYKTMIPKEQVTDQFS